MKKILGIAALSMGVMLTSCSDFLDQKADSALDQENVFNSSYFTGLEINKIYGDFGQDNMYANRMTISYGANTDTELIDGLGSTSTSSVTILWATRSTMLQHRVLLSIAVLLQVGTSSMITTQTTVSHGLTRQMV